MTLIMHQNLHSNQNKETQQNCEHIVEIQLGAVIMVQHNMTFSTAL